MKPNLLDRTIYQKHMREYLNGYEIIYKQARLFVYTQENHQDIAKKTLVDFYCELENHIEKYPEFATSLVPLEKPFGISPPIEEMYESSALADVGPMAGVAGCVAKAVASALCTQCDEVFVENGGDVFVISKEKRTVSIYAGDSPLSLRAGIVLPPGEWAVCTSAGRIGHSLSFGNCHAAVCVSKNPVLCDSCATALGNMVKTSGDIPGALVHITSIKNITGALCIIDEHIGFMGEIEITPIL